MHPPVRSRGSRSQPAPPEPPGWAQGSRGRLRAPLQPAGLCAGLGGRGNLGSVQFPSWPNAMHKGRSVPAAADALSPPEPPAHEQPYLEAGIFHSIPRHSDMLQCPGTLAALPGSAADTQQTRRIHSVATPEPPSRTPWKQPAPGKAVLNDWLGTRGVPAPLWGPAAGDNALPRGREPRNRGADPRLGRVLSTITPRCQELKEAGQQHPRPPAASGHCSHPLQLPCPTTATRPPAPRDHEGARRSAQPPAPCSPLAPLLRSPAAMGPCSPSDQGSFARGRRNSSPTAPGADMGSGPTRRPCAPEPHAAPWHGARDTLHEQTGASKGPGPGCGVAPALLLCRGAKGRARPSTLWLQRPTKRTT